MLEAHRANWICSLALLGTLLPATAALGQGRITTPKEQFGFNLGDDYQLTNYTQLVDYWRKLERESDRLKLFPMGPTAEGREMLLAVITSPRNHRNLDRYKQISRQLATAEGLDDAAAHKLAQEGKAVVWIDGGLHATEVLGAQQLMEMVFQMVSRDDDETLRFLDDVILLLCCANPDGMELVSDWYMREEDPLKRSSRGIPRLYQKYIGHDNNRDFYMASQAETVAITHVFFHEWFPQIVYNHHQTGPAGAVLFAPPFRDPFNYNFDPLVVLGVDVVGAAMHSRFIAERKPGATMRRGASYSTWWNGGLRTGVYFHNMIGLLTETIGNPTPSSIPFRVDRQLASANMPYPIVPQEWHFRQSVDYSITANRAVLDVASRNREHMLFNIYQMGRNSIERGNRDNWTVRPRQIEKAREAMRAAAEARRGGGGQGRAGQSAPRSTQGGTARSGSTPAPTAATGATATRSASAGAARRGEATPKASTDERSAATQPPSTAETSGQAPSAADAKVEPSTTAGAPAAPERPAARVATDPQGLETFNEILRDPALRDPRGYVIPSDQPDFVTATKFVNALIKNGITVHRATSYFNVNDKTYPVGSYVIKCAQAFRPHILDMFEPQDHPDDIPYPGGPPTPPYDSAGWTLAFQMGVQFDRILDGFDGPFQKIAGLARPPAGVVTRPHGAVGYLLSHEVNDSFIAVNRLLRTGEDVYWLKSPVSAVDQTLPVGTMYIPHKPGTLPKLQKAAAELGLTFYSVTSRPEADSIKLRPVRIGLWDRYGGSMPSGWVRWILEQFEFEFDVVFPPDLDAGDLADKYDVLVFVGGAIPRPPGQQATGRRGRGRRRGPDPESVPEEYRARMGNVTVDKTVPQLKAFLEAGGTMITIGSSTSMAYHLDLPIRNALADLQADGTERALGREEYYVPGSVLRVKVDTTNPLAYGMPEDLDVYFNRSPVFRLAPDAGFAGVNPVAWFDTDKPLRSGWAWGQHHLKDGVAAIEARVGKGTLYLFGPEITFRSQPHATYKFLFNAIFYGPVRAGESP